MMILSLFAQTTTLEMEVKQIAGKPKEISVYRLTYYHDGDNYGSGTCTASGICTNRFQVNEKGWYTYKGKLVVATAVERYIPLSRYGYRENITYRHIYDEIDIMIDGTWYKAIVLDICGKCHDEARIDLFIKENGIDRKEVYVK
jgi:hypothetical protein